MRTIFLIIFILLFNQVFACECFYPNPKTKEKSYAELKLTYSFEKSTVIFYGKFIGNSKFKSIKFYRGEELFTNPSLISGKDDSNRTKCDYFFEKDKKYLIFGRINEKGKLITTICDSNMLIKKKRN